MGLYSKMGGTFPFVLVYKPYIIDLGTKAEGEEYLAYNKRRWGGDGWTYSMKSSSKKDNCHFANWVWWANTQLAHQLLLYSENDKKQREVSSVLFRMSYEDGENISIPETILKAAKEIGIDEDFKEYLGSKQAYNDVKVKDRAAKQRGVSGVPYFIMSRGSKKHELSGAQRPETFLEVFKDLAL